MHICFICKHANSSIFPRNVLSYRCEFCMKINCLMCRSDHDMGCELFHILNESSGVNTSPGPPRSILKRRVSFSDINSIQRSENVRAPIDVDSESRETPPDNPVPTVPENIQAAVSDFGPSTSAAANKQASSNLPETVQANRIYCDSCQQFYHPSAYPRHLLTIKHRENYKNGPK